MNTPVRIRKFERGASGLGLDGFLNAHGYSVTANGSGAYRLRKKGQPGRGKTMQGKKLIAFLDELRIAKGLEPIRKANQP